MAYTNSDTKDIVTDLEEPFSQLRGRFKRIHDAVFNRHDYAKDLSPDMEQRKSFGPTLLRRDLRMVKALLRNNLSLHLEPVDGARDAAADRLEVMQSHDLLMLDPKGFIRENIHHYQFAGPFWAGWLDDLTYLPPTRWENEDDEAWTKRAKRHRESHFGFQLLDKDPFSVAYREHNRALTMASCRVELPIIDLLERYGESYKVTRDNPDHMLKICREHFPFIRADEGTAPDWGDKGFWNKNAEVIIWADANRIYHCIDLEPGTDAKRYRNKGGERYESLGDGSWENPFGDIPLLLVSGTYNPHEELQYRREGIGHSLIEIEDGKAFYKSYWASMTASAPRLYEDMPDAVKEAFLEMQNAGEKLPPATQFEVDSRGKPVIARPLGAIRVAPREISDIEDKIYSILNEEAAGASMQGLLFDPQAGQRLQNIPVSTVLAQRDAMADGLGEAMLNETNEWSRALDMLMHARQHKLNSHRKQGDKQRDSDWGYRFKATGKEKVKNRVIAAGEEISTRPQDYDGEYTRTIEPVDDRAASRAAARAEATNAYQQGALLYDEFLGSYGIEDVNTFKQRKYEEQMFQMHAPRFAADGLMKAAYFTSILNGTPIEQEMANMPPPEQMAAAYAGQQGIAPSTGSNTNMTQVASPHQNTVPPGAAAVQEMG